MMGSKRPLNNFLRVTILFRTCIRGAHALFGSLERPAIYEKIRNGRGGGVLNKQAAVGFTCVLAERSTRPPNPNSVCTSYQIYGHASR